MTKAAAASSPEPEETTIPATKPFNGFLNEHRGAGLHNELSEHLAELVSACTEHQKKGTLELKIKVAPADGNPSAVVVTDEVKLKAPQADPTPSLFFSDTAGNLSRRDPRQPEIAGLRDASSD